MLDVRHDPVKSLGLSDLPAPQRSGGT
jgi:hypothetical protein